MSDVGDWPPVGKLYPLDDALGAQRVRQCPLCAALVTSQAIHEDWHAELARRIEQALDLTN